MSLYPLKFTPRLVEKMWAGRKLQTELGKELPAGKNFGESWEIYDFPPGVVDRSEQWSSSIVSNGPLKGMTLHDLMLAHRRELIGENATHGQQFPLLIKFLDAREDLSIQVHPDEAYCAAHAEAHLKSEAWYVIAAEPGARLFKGLKHGVTREQYASSVQKGTSEALLATVPVIAGDCHYLPSGTVHAIGAGILVAEVQTPSDTTFRVYDFNRVDATTGQQRTLHVEQAMACIHFDTPAASPAPPNGPLVDCEFFKIARHSHGRGHRDDLSIGKPAIWIMLQGNIRLSVADLQEPIAVRRGETLLLPAAMDNPRLQVDADATWLKVTL